MNNSNSNSNSTDSNSSIAANANVNVNANKNNNPNNTWIWYVCIIVPTCIVIVIIILASTILTSGRYKKPKQIKCTSDANCQNGGTCLGDGTCACSDLWTGSTCQLLKTPLPVLPSNSSGWQCGIIPKSCSVDDECLKCGTSIPFKCTSITKDKNKVGLEGKYCLPALPLDACEFIPPDGDFSKTIPGIYIWEGWSDVQTEKWTCACEYPAYYSQTIDGDSSGACSRTKNLCRGGTWIYPCKPNPVTPNKCLEITPAEEKALLGSSPFENGRCDCSNTPCTPGGTECIGTCVNGICEGQRTALDPVTGVPICVLDTCYPNGKWQGQLVPPYAYGRCMCDADAVDTGFGCVKKPPPPPAAVCDDNCHGNGICLKDNICQCEAGWKGKTCEIYYCDDNCAGKGLCVGPNQCQCQDGETWVPPLSQCVPVKTCTPKPVVDPKTGNISNIDQFPDPYQTQCEHGSDQALQALCVTSPCEMQRDADPYPVHCELGDTWDGYAQGVCYKNFDCSGIKCDNEEWCNSNVTIATGPIYKINATPATCANPTLDQVQQLCEGVAAVNTNPGEQPAPTLLTLIDGQYQCIAMTPRQTITVNMPSLEIIEDIGINGIICVGMSSSQKQTDLPFQSGFFRLVTPPNLNSGNAGSVIVDGVVTLIPVLAPSFCPDATGASYSFNIYFSQYDPSIRAQLKEGATVDFYLFAIPKWAKGYTLYSLTSPLTLVITGSPQKDKVSPYLLPKLNPDAAFELSRDAGWITSALSGLSGIVENLSGVSALAALKPGAQELVVQAACLDSYCKTFQGGAGMKLIIISWDVIQMPPDLGGMCAGVNRELYTTVKYVLSRINTLGENVPLIVPTSILKSFTVPSTAAKVYYYVDVLPIGNNAVYTYSLGSYVAQANDTFTTYDTSPCKSRMVYYSTSITPYTEEFCQSIPAPSASEVNPPFTWVNNSTGMCEWQPAGSDIGTAAMDYYCSILKTNNVFPANAISLQDSQNNCGTLKPSYPSLNLDWTSATCDPGTDTGYSTDICIGGTEPQARNVVCTEALAIEGGGEITNAITFHDRMNALSAFYNQHHIGPPALNIERIKDAASQTALYNEVYYNCGLKDESQKSSWGVSQSVCAEKDEACKMAAITGETCLTQNDCTPWLPQSNPDDSIQIFQQNRRCYPSNEKFVGDSSPCCNYEGEYKITPGDPGIARGSCNCAGTTYTGTQCTVNSCEGQTCNNKGDCKYDTDTKTVRCVCDAGYYNYNPKDALDLQPATPNAFACNKNPCAKDKNQVICGGTPWGDSAPTLGGVPTVPVKVGDNAEYWQGGICDEAIGLCKCADGFQCWDNPDPEYAMYKGMCLMTSNYESGKGYNGCGTATCTNVHQGDPRWCGRTCKVAGSGGTITTCTPQYQQFCEKQFP